MARIRIIDEWLRSPVSPPSRYRAIMVVAERWGEQRVLMRAFQECPDQTRPTIVLHGEQLAIGPAGTDPSGPWGIHVQPPVDGRAQELRGQLELAAKRLVGARVRNPARLEDEDSGFEGKQTNYWAPGTPRDRQSRPAVQPYYEPAAVAPPSDSTEIPSAAPRQAAVMGAAQVSPTPVPHRAPPSPTPVPRTTPAPAGRPARRRGWTSPVPTQPAKEVGSRVGSQVGSRTAHGFAGAPITHRGGSRAESDPGTSKKLSKLVRRTMPSGFQITSQERDVLNALGDAPHLTARQIGAIAGVDDPVAWMERLMAKLAEHGLDLVIPGDDREGEPTYVLRR